jgi:hypothetical protein
MLAHDPRHFCDRTPAASSALTARSRDLKKMASRRREVLPVCRRCHRLLAKAGDEGRRVKMTGERWWLGHGVGRFQSRGPPKPH